MDRPDWGLLAYHAVVPHFAGTESILLATGILGATVMPHAIFLHSGLTQGRIVTREPKLLRRIFRFEVVDVLIAMSIAGLVNMAMLVMAASTFFQHGLSNIGTIEEAHRTLVPLLGGAASFVFALSLLASGHSSSTVGTMAGQIIMQGFIHRRIPMLLRRLMTMVPSFVVIAMRLDPTNTLVLSQVVLSFGLPFAIIPLVFFTARKDIMGMLANHKLTTVLAALVAAPDRRSEHFPAVPDLSWWGELSHVQTHPGPSLDTALPGEAPAAVMLPTASAAVLDLDARHARQYLQRVTRDLITKGLAADGSVARVTPLPLF